MNIELLVAPDCSGREPTSKLIHSILDELALEADFKITLVDSDDMAQSLKFPGSPTVRVNGKDIDEQAENTDDFRLG